MHSPTECEEVCFVSLFTLAPGTKQIQPIIRSGKIALMPHEPVTVEVGPYNKQATHVYLVECLSWGGCSGAPVLVAYPNFSGVATNIADINLCSPVALLGLVSSHFDIHRQSNLNGDNQIQIPNNAGIAAVIPSQAIWDLLLLDELKQQRDAIEKSQSLDPADTGTTS